MTATAPAQLPIGPVIDRALRDGATLAISISGGKDSLAMMNLLARHPDRSSWSGRMCCLHADLGRAEWEQTPEQVKQQTRLAGLELMIVRRSAGDFLDRLEHELQRVAGTGKSFWPTTSKRYCSSDMKRDPMLRLHRQLGGVVIAAQGVRAGESAKRAQRNPISLEPKATAKRLLDMSVEEALALRRPDERVVINWLPIQALTEDQVWTACDTSAADLERRRALYRAYQATGNLALWAESLADWPAHPAYVYGSSRLSCALCVLGSRNDLAVGARHNANAFSMLLDMERRSGFHFQKRFSLERLLEC